MKTFKIRYHHSCQALTLPDLYKNDHLLTLFHDHYPATMEPAYVQFIPEANTDWRVETDSMSVDEMQKRKQQIAGTDHELAIQQKFGQIRDQQLIIIPNLQQSCIKEKKLKRLFKNEFDLLLFHHRVGLIIVEIKQRSYDAQTTNKFDIAKEKEKQAKRHSLISSIRSLIGSRVPVHTLLLLRSRNQCNVFHEVEKGPSEEEVRLVCDFSVDSDVDQFWSEVENRIRSITIPSPSTASAVYNDHDYCRTAGYTDSRAHAYNAEDVQRFAALFVAIQKAGI